MILQDLSTLQTIPGYVSILKAVLKAQIQVLVEQLHEQAGEETLVLTTSMKEGTLCHLGSNKGQGFLTGRDDIKSQFLAYCQQENIAKEASQNVYPLYYRNFDSLAPPQHVQAPQPLPVQTSVAPKQTPPVALHWNKTITDQPVTVIDSSNRKFAIVTDLASAMTKGNNTNINNPISLLGNRNTINTCSTKIISPILISGQNQLSLVNNRSETIIPYHPLCPNSLPANRQPDMTTVLEPSTSTPVLTNLHPVELPIDRAIVSETSKSPAVDVKDKNKKKLSSKIEEITERIKKDETQKLDSPLYAADVEGSQDNTDISTGHAGKHKLLDAVPDVSPSKLKDVSRASHRKPKQPRFNIGVASDEEDSDVIKKSDDSLTEEVFNITVNMDDSDSTLMPVSLDDLGDGVLLKESVTDIPIVEYNNSDNVNKSIIENTFNLKPKSRKNKRFTQSIHVYGSNREKNWLKCGMCPEKFPTQEAINHHLQNVIHTPKKCECDFCGRTFGQLRDMERHRRIHTGERPFTCDVCNRSFARKDNLKSHKMNHMKKQLKMETAVDSKHSAVANEKIISLDLIKEKNFTSACF